MTKDERFLVSLGEVETSIKVMRDENRNLKIIIIEVLACETNILSEKCAHAIVLELESIVLNDNASAEEISKVLKQGTEKIKIMLLPTQCLLISLFLFLVSFLRSM